MKRQVPACCWGNIGEAVLQHHHQPFKLPFLINSEQLFDTCKSNLATSLCWRCQHNKMLQGWRGNNVHHLALSARNAVDKIHAIATEPETYVLSLSEGLFVALGNTPCFRRKVVKIRVLRSLFFLLALQMVVCRIMQKS